MATATLERTTEVVRTPAAAAVSVEDVAKGESKAKVEGSGSTKTARAWGAKAQVD